MYSKAEMYENAWREGKLLVFENIGSRRPQLNDLRKKLEKCDSKK